MVVVSLVAGVSRFSLVSSVWWYLRTVLRIIAIINLFIRWFFRVAVLKSDLQKVYHVYPITKQSSA